MVAGGFLPRGSLGGESDKEEEGFGTDSSDERSPSNTAQGRPSYEVAGDEPTVGQLRVPMRELPLSMTVRRPEKPIVRAELPAANAIHELP